MDHQYEKPSADPREIPAARRPVEPMPRRVPGAGRVLARPIGSARPLHDLIPRQHGRPHD